jgi:protein-tyrosine sulfotransferase
MRLHDLKKYLDYTLENKSFAPMFSVKVSDAALQAARSIRGSNLNPALIVHGMMPRSGTVYIGELLRLHPSLYAYPYQLWEVPFLQLAGEVLELQERFFSIYEQNRGKIGEHDFLPLFGASLISYLHTAVPSGQRILLKVPSVQYLSCFGAMFPGEQLLVLVRDGRDVVHSTLRTWPQLSFTQACRRWNLAARMVLEVDRHMSRTRPGQYALTRFEDAVNDPLTFVREACRRFGLEENCYPYDRIAEIPLRGSSVVSKKGEVSWEPVKRPDGFEPIGYWRRWSILKKWIFKRIAGPSLMALGYCEDLNW